MTADDFVYIGMLFGAVAVLALVCLLGAMGSIKYFEKQARLEQQVMEGKKMMRKNEEVDA